MFKKVAVLFSFVIMFFLPITVNAQFGDDNLLKTRIAADIPDEGFRPYVEPPGFEDFEIAEETGLGSRGPTDVVVNIITWIVGFLALIFLCLMIYGGFTWMFAAGNDDRIKKAKGIIKAGVIGLLIIMSSYGITIFIIDLFEKKTI
jgi:hypothetical protein